MCTACTSDAGPGIARARHPPESEGGCVCAAVAASLFAFFAALASSNLCARVVSSLAGDAPCFGAALRASAKTSRNAAERRVLREPVWAAVQKAPMPGRPGLGKAAPPVLELAGAPRCAGVAALAGSAEDAPTPCHLLGPSLRSPPLDVAMGAFNEHTDNELSGRANYSPILSQKEWSCVFSALCLVANEICPAQFVSVFPDAHPVSVEARPRLPCPVLFF